MYGTKHLGRAFDTLYSEKNASRLERAVMIASTVGFLLHLLVIAIVRNSDHPPELFEAAGRSYFNAIYTPFSFILFYEVLMLVRALPRSLTTAIGKQFEIVSLIAVRSVFKDIGDLGDIEQWTEQTDKLVKLLIDMGGAALMFVLVGCFYHLRRPTAPRDVPDRLGAYIDLKKAMATCLTVLFVGLALYSLLDWAAAVANLAVNAAPYDEDLDLIFFPELFKILIFTDVLLLIVSFSISHSYRFVFRNAGFVISTILLRVSITSPAYYDVIAAVIGMTFGILILASFNYISYVHRTQSRLDPDHDDAPQTQ